jgi:CRP/FNR family transcriptional regulator, cyclic AMP receptor protein
MTSPRPSLAEGIEYLGPAASYADDVFDVIREHTLFEEFTHREIDILCQFMHCFAAPRDAIVLRENDVGDYLMLILTGQVQVCKMDREGDQVVIATVGPGTMLGEMSLIDGEQRFASCVAAKPSDFAVLRRPDLNQLLTEHPRLANKFLIKMLEIMVRRLRETSNQLLRYHPTPAV